MNTFLVMKGIIGIPWYKSSQLMFATDAVGNEFYFYSIPMWTLIFSVIDILKCTVLTNIFNVYIGKISSWAIFKKYVNLIFGQLPFFLHAILFRVLAYSFLVLYLNDFAIIPIFCIWLSNLVIGYAMASNKQARKDLLVLKDELKRTNVPRIEEGSPKPRAILQKSTPIWLNSFFSIMVPTCSVNIIDPQLVHSNEGNERLQTKFSNFNKKYQMKAMRMLLLASNFIILVAVGMVCWRVNRPESSDWNYNANIFGNLEFNILCCVLFVMGMMSMVFMKSTDVYELLRLNRKKREEQMKTSKCMVLMKIIVTVACIVIVLG